MSVLSRGAARLPQVPVPLMTWAARRWLLRSFGEPPVSSADVRTDQGLLGPGSASWQLFADAASIVGGIRSLLVQLTHPLAMAGVARHSRYLDDPLSRLQDTSRYVALVTYGTGEQALQVTERTRAIHRHVSGALADGRTYAAADPELLTWVSVVATESWLRSDADFGADPLDQTGRDAYVAEQARVAALLDPRADLTPLRGAADPAAVLREMAADLPLIASGWLPLDEASLRERMEWFAPRLSVGDEGRDALEFLLWPPVDPLLRLGYLPTLAGALGSLDAHTCRLLGLPASPAAGRLLRLQSEVALVALRAALARPSPNAQAAQQAADAAAA